MRGLNQRICRASLARSLGWRSGHPKISIPGGETTKKTPPGIEPANVSKEATRPGARRLCYVRLATSWNSHTGRPTLGGGVALPPPTRPPLPPHFGGLAARLRARFLNLPGQLNWLGWVPLLPTSAHRNFGSYFGTVTSQFSGEVADVAVIWAVHCWPCRARACWEWR